MHYYKRNIGDYHRKAGRLTMLQHGAYTLIMDSCYDREQFPTREQAIDWCWASTPEEIAAVDFVLNKFFILSGDVFVQGRINDELERYHGNAETNRRIALEREENRRNRARIEDEHSTNRARQEDEPPPNQEPLTTNQEPQETHTENPSESGKPDPCPHQAIVDLYNQILPELARVRDITEKRKKSLRARWRADDRFQSLEWWRKFFSAVAADDFLMGRVHGKTWQADFDFLLRPDKFQKIIEGGYQRGDQ